MYVLLLKLKKGKLCCYLKKPKFKTIMIIHHFLFYLSFKPSIKLSFYLHFFASVIRLLPAQHFSTSYVRLPGPTSQSRPIQIWNTPHRRSGHPLLYNQYPPSSSAAEPGRRPANPGGGPDHHSPPEAAPPRASCSTHGLPSSP